MGKFHLRSRRKYFLQHELKVYENARQMVLMLSLGFNGARAVIKSISFFVAGASSHNVGRGIHKNRLKINYRDAFDARSIIDLAITSHQAFTTTKAVTPAIIFPSTVLCDKFPSWRHVQDTWTKIKCSIVPENLPAMRKWRTTLVFMSKKLPSGFYNRD